MNGFIMKMADSDIVKSRYLSVECSKGHQILLLITQVYGQYIHVTQQVAGQITF